eukprot:CAMPEP_0170521068 /NCGR_PEP_ID=MMETSP0209-20121228/6380_1 /TAXON_ID=665100 ORGANISM="Litonotus pictus, Strain P1" /NCGR_SAMPLE_ID=MMETSP0209 /ASSEMBLY_ACC=CAM_ASM_000301 /LENGTH=295 /DNA_ID=CAMNT_0010807713 /DNA_START=365 /DNA_END=1252 /DNA_ORIENTATION=-
MIRRLVNIGGRFSEGTTYYSAFDYHYKGITSVCLYEENCILTTGGDNFIKLLAIKSKELKGTYKGHSHIVNQVAVLSKAKVVSVDQGCVVLIWSPTNFSTLQKLKNPASRVALLPDLNMVLADTAIDFYSLVKNDYYNHFSFHTKPVRSLLVHDEIRLVSAADDLKIVVSMLKDGHVLSTLQGHFAEINKLVSINDDMIASGSLDHTIRIWSLSHGKCYNTLENDCGVYSVLKLSDDLLVSGDEKGVIKFWDLSNNEVVFKREKAHDRSINDMIKVDTLSFISVCNEATINLWKS